MHWVIICVNSLILCCYTRLTPHFSTDKSGLWLRNKNATQVHWLHWCESNPHGMNDTEMNECPYNKINLLSSVMLLGSNGLTTPNMVFKKILKLWEIFDSNFKWMSLGWSWNERTTHSANPIQLGLLYKFTGSWIVTEGLYLWWQNHCGIWRPGKQWLKAQRLL